MKRKCLRKCITYILTILLAFTHVVIADEGCFDSNDSSENNIVLSSENDVDSADINDDQILFDSNKNDDTFKKPIDDLHGNPPKGEHSETEGEDATNENTDINGNDVEGENTDIVGDDVEGENTDIVGDDVEEEAVDDDLLDLFYTEALDPPDTYCISSAKELYEFALAFNDDDDGDRFAMYTTISLYKLDEPYDLSIYKSNDNNDDDDDKWQGIGNSDNPFDLTFEGNGATIILPDGTFLFGNVVGTSSSIAKINDVTIIDDDDSSAGIGGLVKKGSYVTITDCANYGSITTGSNNAYGSMVAYAKDNVTLDKCTNYGDVSASGSSTIYAGGLIGYFTAPISGSSYPITLSACTNTGSVSASSTDTNSAYAGGLIGLTNESSVSNLAISGATNGDENSSANITAYAFSGNAYAGGILGYAQNGTKTISGSTNYSNVAATSTNTHAYAGGIFGFIGEITLASLSNYGSVDASSNSDASYVYAGGLIGHAAGGIYTGAYSTNISNLLNKGNISSSSNIAFVGGLFGHLSSNVTLDSASNSGNLSYSTANTNANTSTSYMGGFIAYAANSIEISGTSENSGNITSDGSVKMMHVGGMIGYANDAVTISNSGEDCAENAGKISVSDANSAYVGGVVGTVIQDFTTSGADSVSNTASISVNDCASAYVGGLLGNSSFDSEDDSLCIYNFVNSGDISVNLIDTSDLSEAYLGGVVGYLDNDLDNSVEEYIILDCFNSGNISSATSSAQDDAAGGILGANNTEIGVSIKSCGNMGNISACQTGGMIGFSNSVTTDPLTIENCFNGGNLYGKINAGGLIGYSYSSTISLSYNFGIISASSSAVDNGCAGGLVGSAKDSIAISNSYNTGYVNGYNASGILYGTPAENGIELLYCYNSGYISGTNDVGIIPLVEAESCYSLEQVPALDDVNAEVTYEELACGTVLNYLNDSGAIWTGGSSSAPAFPTLSANSDSDYSAVSAAVVMLNITTDSIIIEGYYPKNGDGSWTESTYSLNGISKYIYIPNDAVDGLLDDIDISTTYAQYSSARTIDLSKVATASSYEISETGDYYEKLSIDEDDILTIHSDCFIEETSSDVPPITFSITYTTEAGCYGTINYSVTVDEVDNFDFVVYDLDDLENSTTWTAESFDFNQNIELKTVKVAEDSFVDLSDWEVSYSWMNSTDNPFGKVRISVVHDWVTDSSSTSLVLYLGTFELYLGTAAYNFDTGLYTLGNAGNETVYYLNASTGSLDDPKVYYESGIPFYVDEENTTYQFGIEGEEYNYVDGGDIT